MTKTSFSQFPKSNDKKKILTKFSMLPFPKSNVIKNMYKIFISLSSHHNILFRCGLSCKNMPHNRHFLNLYKKRICGLIANKTSFHLLNNVEVRNSINGFC